MNIILILIDRIRTESPRLFVVLRWVSGVLAAAGWVGTWLISKGVWSPAYAAAISDLANGLALLATGMWGTSFLPKKDQVVIKTDTVQPAADSELIGSRDKDDR